MISILGSTLSKDVEIEAKGVKEEEGGEEMFMRLALAFPEQDQGPGRACLNVAKLGFRVSGREEVAQTFMVPGAGS